MAFLLKSTRFVHTAVRFTSKRGLLTKRKTLFVECPRVVNLYTRNARTAVSARTEESIKQNEPDRVESLIFHLNRDIKYKNILTKDIEDVVNAIRERGELKDAQLTLLLKCCSESVFMATNHERITLAENIWKAAESFGVTFDLNHYNSLLSVFLNNEHKFSIEDFFDILKNKNIEPNYVTYRLALKAYCQQGDIEGATKILTKLKELDYALREEDFSSLIQGHCEIGDFEKATELLNIMQKKDLKPTSSSYVKLLLGYAKHGKIEELNNLLDKLSQDKITIGNYNLLEIIYTLSVNNHESHIDSFMNRLNPNGENSLQTARIIQKLLHNKNDSLALRIFEHTITPGLQAENIISRSKFIIKHFVMYRNPSEVLKICKHMEKKGWTNAALSYALREVLLHKDDVMCLKFLNAMKKEGLEIRNHYYWPVIIKASKRGTFWLRDILQRLPKSAFTNSYETTHKVIFPNYNFKNSSDFDFLCGLGINRRLLSYCFFERHLLQKDLEKAEHLIIRQHVTTRRWKHSVNCLLSAFTHDPSKDQSFLNVLRAYAHDYYYVRTLLQSNTEDDLEDNVNADDADNIFDYAIVSLVRRLKNEEVIMKLLEGMLSKKMGISPKAANIIASSFQNEKIGELATKLASPEAKFELDRSLLQTKMWKIPSDVFLSVSDSAKDLVFNPSTNASTLAEKVLPETPITDAMFFAVVLGHKGIIKEAFNVLNKLASRNPEPTPQAASAIELFRCFIFKQANNSGKSVFDALDLGAQMGFSEKTLQRMIKQVLEGNNLGDALNVYLEKVSRYGKIDGCLLLMTKAAKEKNHVAIKKIKKATAEILTSDLLSSYHAIALATTGQVERAKAVLDRENVVLRQRVFYTHCEVYYPQATPEVYENYLELVRDLKNFDRSPLYRLLLRKYAENKLVDKALKLCITVEEDEIPDYRILKEITKFKDDPTPEHLEELASNLQTDVVLPKERSDDKVSESGTKTKSKLKIGSRDSIINSASSGNVSNVLILLQRYPMADVKSVCTAFLKNGKIEEFFQFLNQYAQGATFNSISNCFNIDSLLPFLEDNANFQQYKAMALKCLDEGYITAPLISLFVTSVKMSTRLSEAESLVEQYSAHFQNIPFLEICEEAKIGGCEIDFYENFVSSENLKSNFPEYHHVMYNKLIKYHSANDNLKSALQYLEMAVSNSAGKFIDKDTINLLEQKLRNTGQSFPHPELLSTPSVES